MPGAIEPRSPVNTNSPIIKPFIPRSIGYRDPRVIGFTLGLHTGREVY